jgi:hypothetical protein
MHTRDQTHGVVYSQQPVPVRFAYDMESYSQNFDGGLGSTDRHYL